MNEIVIRRGSVLWEWRYRDEADTKFRTTKVPTRPLCRRPARCAYCDGIVGPNGIVMVMPIQIERMKYNGVGTVDVAYHTITPPQASHLVAFEFAQAHPGQPVRIGWLLTEEEKAAGKKGQEWPSDI